MINHTFPAVSIILPVYNCERYIDQAIDSLLAQQYPSMEIVIIDDCSNDKTAQIIKSYNDARIKYYRNSQNLGVTHSLNKAISLSTGEFLARMDGDDISHPLRIKKQVDFLLRNSHIDIIGTDAYFIDEKSRISSLGVKINTSPKIIKWRSLRRTCLYHPSVMFRRSAIPSDNILYSNNYLHSEDTELWIRFSKDHQLANLDERLLYYRAHQENISHIHNKTAVATLLQALKDHNPLAMTKENAATIYEQIRFPQRVKDKDNYNSVCQTWCEKINKFASEEALCEKDKRQLKLIGLSFIILISASLIIKRKTLPLFKLIKYIKSFNPSFSDFIIIAKDYIANIFKRIVMHRFLKYSKLNYFLKVKIGAPIKWLENDKKHHAPIKPKHSPLENQLQ